MPDSIVAFADALGTSSSALDEKTAFTFLNGLQAASRHLAPQLKRLQKHRGIGVRWFSDSILMSARLSQDGNHAIEVIKNLAAVQGTYAFYGVLLRGAMVRGPHHHGPDIDYGPALARAVHLEKEAGNAVRIILSRELVYDLARNPALNPHVVVDLDDDTAFLDFLHFVDGEARRSLRQRLETIFRALPKSSDDRTRAKLQWLAAYFNWKVKRRTIPFASTRRFEELGGANA